MSANRPYDDDLPGRGYSSRHDPDTGDHEISLGTPTILGIFFALALVCAAFFGFGYTLGRRSVPSAPPVVAAVPFGNGSGASKPAAGSASGQSATPTQPSNTPAPQTAVVSLTPASTPALTPAVNQQPTPNPQPAAAPQPATANPQAAASFFVQVAAVSSQDVADILTSSLQKKGYTVGVHHEPQDKLLHVQIGPFTDKKEAEAMQKRVLADGFNAIVK
jgi:cell division septation protein DedD